MGSLGRPGYGGLARPAGRLTRYKERGGKSASATGLFTLISVLPVPYPPSNQDCPELSWRFGAGAGAWGEKAGEGGGLSDRQEPGNSDPIQPQGFWEGDQQPQNAAAFLDKSAS